MKNLAYSVPVIGDCEELQEQYGLFLPHTSVSGWFLGGSRFIKHSVCTGPHDSITDETDYDVCMLAKDAGGFRLVKRRLIAEGFECCGEDYEDERAPDSAFAVYRHKAWSSGNMPRLINLNVLLFKTTEEFHCVWACTAYARMTKMYDKEERYEFFNNMRAPWRAT